MSIETIILYSLIKSLLLQENAKADNYVVGVQTENTFIMETVLSMVVAMALLVYFIWISRKGAGETLISMNEPTVLQMGESGFREQLCKELGAEIKVHKDGWYRVGYQGGVFDFEFKKSNYIIDVYYRCFNELKHEESVQATWLANEMNLRHRWTCFLTRAEAGQKEKPVQVNLSLTLFPQGTVKDVATTLKGLLPYAFEIQREFNSQMRELLSQKKVIAEENVDNDFLNKMELMKLRQEVGHHLDKPQVEELPPDEQLTVEALTGLFVDVEWGCPVAMCVLMGGKPESEEAAGAIMKFNIRDYIRKCAASAIPQEISIIVTFERENLLVNLKKEEGGTPKTLFYRICVSRNGNLNKEFLLAPQSIASMIEVRLTTEKEDVWEAKYLIDDALDKWNNGKRAEMTDEQREVVDCVMPNMEMELYWGKKLYNQECYLQALSRFRHIFNHLNYQWVNQTKENRDYYYRICFYIGFIYMELGLHDVAYYYLHRAQESDKVAALREYINCLCNMEDIDAIRYIQPMRERVFQILNKKEEPEAHVLRFYCFVNRRMAYTLVNNGQWDEATTMLQQMIENGEDVEFAKAELAYIEEQKKKEKRQ